MSSGAHARTVQSHANQKLSRLIYGPYWAGQSFLGHQKSSIPKDKTGFDCNAFTVDKLFHVSFTTNSYKQNYHQIRMQIQEGWFWHIILDHDIEMCNRNEWRLHFYQAAQVIPTLRCPRAHFLSFIFLAYMINTLSPPKHYLKVHFRVRVCNVYANRMFGATLGFKLFLCTLYQKFPGQQ